MTGLLIVLSGLPGTGKSSAAQRVAHRLGASWLRIDAIEQALRQSLGLGEEVGEAGYAVAYALAGIGLDLGQAVIADCVNPLALTRTAWREVARRAAAPILEVEMVCSDTAEHRRRVEQRTNDIEGLALPTWSAVLARRYEPWDLLPLIVDTATITADEAASEIVRAAEPLSRPGGPPGASLS